MTDLKKTIKREMTREKFLEIRNKEYGDGNNILKLTYGQVSSWLAWNRDEKDQILKVKPPYDYLTRGRAYYDGPIDNWDQDKISPRITTDIVFIGLNMSGDGKPTNELRFQNARGHRRIVETFRNTAAEGAYFTDIIKPDNRILNKVKPSNSRQVIEFVNAHRDILEEHVRLFEKELDDIGADKPLLIVFGGDAEWVLKQGIYNNFFTKKFHAIVVITHYAHRFTTDEGYKNDTRNKLKPYITIERER